MVKNLFIILLAFFSLQFSIGQEHKDWPSTSNYVSKGDDMISRQYCDRIEVKHKEIISDTLGREYYCSGNVHAEGPIKKVKSDTISHYVKNKVLVNEYVRTGDWRVYFDSTLQILRSEGKYKDGKKHGKWVIYSDSGNVVYEFAYWEDQLKAKIAIDQNGKRQTIIQRSDENLFVERHETLLILLAILPIVLFRIGWNILTYNKIHNTNYIPLFQNWQKGGSSVNIYCTLIFWWLIKEDDSDIVKRYKLIGNWISVLSVICFATVMVIFHLYGES